MTLKRVLAAAFKYHGGPPLSETEFVAALALERGWFTPDEARDLIERARNDGLLTGEADALSATFDVSDIAVPADFEPDSAELTEAVPLFERMVDAVEGTGRDRQGVVAGINELQHSLSVSSDAAAILYAHQSGLDVESAATELKRNLEQTHRI